MALSRRAIETLADLVEIKLSCLQIFDREDAREQITLESCRRELAALTSGTGQTVVTVFAEDGQKRGEGQTPAQVAA